MHKAVFRIEADGLYERATETNSLVIDLWCNNHCDLLHISGQKNANFLEMVQDEVGIQEQIDVGSDQIIITSECLKKIAEYNVEIYLAANDCLVLPPLRYESGTKKVRVLALNQRNLTAFYQDIVKDHSVTVESKSELSTVASQTPMLTVNTILPELSDRQREVLMTAYAEGYYEIPRQASAEDVADEVGIKRRTAAHHLRRAENKLLHSIVEYL